MGKKRKGRPGPLTGMYRATDLAQAISLSPRAIRSYVARKLIPPPSGRGTGLIYGEVHMQRLLAMRKMREESGGLLEDIAAELDKLSPAELAARAATAARESAMATGAPVLGAPVLGAPVLGALVGSIPVVGGLVAGSVQAAETWQRVVIVPGLEIHLRADSGPLAQRLAGEMLAQYGTGYRAS